MSSGDFRKDLEIDPIALDIAIIEQPQLFYRYSKMLADAEKEVKQTHERLKVKRSELIKEANEDPDGCLGTGVKPTAAPVEAYYRNHQEHKDAKTALIDAEHERDLLNACVFSIRQRKDTLQGLIQLAIMGYFSTPKDPRNLAIELDKRKGTRGAIRESLKKGKEDAPEPTPSRTRRRNRS